MISGAIRAFIAEIASRFGWLLLIVGLILPGFQVFDHFTTNQTVATIVDIKPLCQKEVCRLDKCRWRKIKCETMAELEAAGTKVRSSPYAKLSFSDSRERVRQTWTSFSKLEIDQAEVGDQIKIAYRGNNRPYVAPPFSWHLTTIGFGISFAGLVLLILSLMLRRKKAAVAEQKPDPNPAKPPRYERARQEAPTQRGRQARKRPADVSVVTHGQTPPRTNSVQRNRGWFS